MDLQVEELLHRSLQKAENGDMAAALQAAEDALESARVARNAEGCCSALAHLAAMHCQMGHYEQANALAIEALAAAERTVGSVSALITMGYCATYTNHIDRAETLWHRAADLSRQIGDALGRLKALHCLAACVYSLQGRFQLALESSAQSHRIGEEIGYADWGYPLIRAEIYRMIGDRQQTRQALAELKQVTPPRSLYRGIYCCYQARLALDEDDVEEAQRWLPESRSIAEAVGSPILDVWVRVECSRCARAQGDIAAATAWADDAVYYARRSGFNYIEVLAAVERAQTTWASGDLVSTEVELENTLAVAIDQGLMYERARITFFLASLAYRCQKPNAEILWSDAAEQIVRGGYAFLLERERALAYPLVAVYLRSGKQKARLAAEHLLKALAKVAPLPLHVHGLGGFRVSVGRTPLPDRHWQRRKAGEMFRFLLLQPRHMANRDVLIDCLWPEQSLESLQSTFHQATSTLRRLLEPDLPDKFPSRYIFVEADRVSLELPPGSTVDFEHFEQRLSAALASQSVEELEQVLALYTDDLFPTDRYTDWAAAPRERLADFYLRGLLLLAQLHLKAGQPYKALVGCRRILERDPWREDAVLLGMQAHLALNDRPAALRLYHTLECLFRQDLGLVPRSDLQELAGSLRQS